MIRTATCLAVICGRCNQSAGKQDDHAIGDDCGQDVTELIDQLAAFTAPGEA